MIRSSFWVAVLLAIPAGLGAMTFDELSRIAYERSLEQSVAHGKQEALRHEKSAYGAFEPLELEGATRRIRADDPNGDGNEYSMMVGITAKNPWVKEAKNAEFDAAIRSAEGDFELRKALIQSRLKHEYLLAGLAREEAEIYRQKQESAEKGYAIARKKHEAGRISQMELVRFETEMGVARKEASQAWIAYRVHQDALREMTHLDGDIRIDDLSFRFIEPGKSEEALKRSAVLEQFSLAEKELTSRIETLRRSAVETVGIGVGMTREPTQHSVDMRLIIPLSFGPKNERRIAALMAMRSATAAQKELAARKLSIATEQSFRKLGELERLIGEAEAMQKRHEALYSMAFKGFEGGITGLFEYLETKNRFYAAQIETLRLKRDYADEMAKTEEKLGRIWE
ncbi:MAG: TolC family protein [Campylobacterota bacterium]